jgi:hypothetical protein
VDAGGDEDLRDECGGARVAEGDGGGDGGRLWGAGFGGDGGEDEGDDGAAVGFGLEFDVTTGALGDLADEWETEAGAHATGLGGEEEVEGAFADIGGHASAAIGDAEADGLAIGGGCGGDLDVAAVWAEGGFVGVDEEVEDGLGEPVGGGLDGGEVGWEGGFDTDARGDGFAEEDADLFPPLGEVGFAGFVGVGGWAAGVHGEEAEAVAKVLEVCDGAADGVDVVERGGGDAGVLDGVEASADGEEHVVHVVAEAGGERAQGCEAVGEVEAEVGGG